MFGICRCAAWTPVRDCLAANGTVLRDDLNGIRLRFDKGWIDDDGNGLRVVDVDDAIAFQRLRGDDCGGLRVFVAAAAEYLVSLRVD